MKIAQTEDKNEATQEVVNVTTIDVKDSTDDSKIVDTFDVEEVESDDDFLIRFEVTNGVTVTLREMTGNDRVYIQELSAKRKGQMAPLEILYRTICRLCVKWGDRDSVTYKYFLDLPFRKLRPIERRIEAVMLHFFRD